MKEPERLDLSGPSILEGFESGENRGFDGSESLLVCAVEMDVAPGSSGVSLREGSQFLWGRGFEFSSALELGSGSPSFLGA